MKTIYKSLRNISLALCATMAISSCDSFLDTKPYDFVAPQTFYTNESECTMALAFRALVVAQIIYIGNHT